MGPSRVTSGIARARAVPTMKRSHGSVTRSRVTPGDTRRWRESRRQPSRRRQVVASKLTSPLEVLPAQLGEIRKRPCQSGSRLYRTRLDDPQVSAGPQPKTRQLVGRDAAVVGYDKLVAALLADCAHDRQCRTSPSGAAGQRRRPDPPCSACWAAAGGAQCAGRGGSSPPTASPSPNASVRAAGGRT
jgi:hypothetical protein